MYQICGTVDGCFKLGNLTTSTVWQQTGTWLGCFGGLASQQINLPSNVATTYTINFGNYVEVFQFEGWNDNT